MRGLKDLAAALRRRLRPSLPPPGGEEVLQFIRDGHRFVWSPPEIRRQIQSHGINIVPADFYSNIPLIEDLETTFEGAPTRRPVYDKVFDAERIAAFLAGIAPFAAEFIPPDEGDEAACSSFFWKNSQFSWTDAMAYYCILRARKPKRVIEIGCGFSTLVADAALRMNGSGEIIAIEPFPRPFLPRIGTVSEIIRARVQDIPRARVLDLVGGADILFIDSTHTVKIGSDCLYLYLTVLPDVRSRLLVHSHDIFLPFGMPLDWARDRQIYWTEQYLLYAYLLQNPFARVVFGSTYATEFLAAQTLSLMGGKCPPGGGSLWFELNAGV
ncbi:class I SAM-dependent methyltransferase [Limobrevibacterium gyesilva]|uniref:Class I SAM-dependent methyltransferase n=1 Tax=Limobrevibacterium gyesilva TaxID=2991712 RepID=A0AA41YK32_9PROT|nr:class I SAM-dependent methyltransferase [Limobrevibacterium gyesilva]MCW3475229.1 class I SAM-dependent methyltransferase [Limobrevibacterium gyesilva]